MASNPDTPGGPATDTYGSGLVNQTDNAGPTYYTCDPSGTLISQRLPNGTAYHYLLDGEGSAVKRISPHARCRRLPVSAGGVIAAYTRND